MVNGAYSTRRSTSRPREQIEEAEQRLYDLAETGKYATTAASSASPTR
jgi:hypothetical protein